MIKKIKIYGALLLVAFSTASCLDQDPRDSIRAKYVVNSVETANQVVVGVYAKFKSTALYSGYLTLLPDIQTDLVHAVQGYSNVYGSIWRWNDILSDNSEITAVYGELYSVIGRCNFFLQEVEQYESTLKDEEKLEKLEWYKGEVYFARALAYSELVKLFCKSYESSEQAAKELGVILVSRYPRDGNGPLTRASLEESYQFILSDLEKASRYLALDEENDEVLYNSTYFTIGAVNSLYARVYLYMRDWEKAVAYSSKVIDSGKYKLASATSKYTSSLTYYEYLWAYDSSTEVIWKVPFETSSYGGALGQVFLNFDWSTYRPDYVPSQTALKKYDNADLRYYAFFAKATTGYGHGLTTELLTKYKGNQNFIDQGILSVNMPKVFRLSEQYLIRAEALSELKNYSAAGKDITAIRKARYKTYGTSTPLSDANWKSVVYDERMKELYMEGFRLHDLKRWHLGFTRESQPFTIAPGNRLNVSADDVRFVWPIPQHELNSPGNNIQPNESNK
ncbi:MAG: RagB/SusD family nutrient uptake outer membrane protein [Phocaeicola sp.]